MIRITDYRNYWLSVASRLGIPTVKTVNGEQQLTTYLRDLATEEFPVLIIVIPSADTIAQDEDNVMEPSTGILFLLNKVDSTEQTEDTMVDDLQQTQDLISDVKRLMLEDRENHQADHLLHYMDFNRLHTDPEFNIAGCNGWSLSFIINSPGF